jgi:hypothetical protein
MDLVIIFTMRGRNAYPKTVVSRDKHGATWVINEMPTFPTVHFKTKLALTETKQLLRTIRFIDIIPPAELACNRNECQVYFRAGKAASAYSWQSYHLRVLIDMKSGTLNLLEHSGPVQACKGIPLPLPGQSYIFKYSCYKYRQLLWRRRR